MNGLEYHIVQIVNYEVIFFGYEEVKNFVALVKLDLEW